MLEVKQITKSIKDKEPIYNLTAGLNQRNISKLTNQVLEKIPELDEWISKKYINKYNFYSWSKSILGIHNPIDRNDFKENNDYRKRLAFDELLAHQLAIYIIRNFNLKKKGINITIVDARFAKPLDENLIWQLATTHEAIMTIEEGSIGGFGSHVIDFLTK